MVDAGQEVVGRKFTRHETLLGEERIGRDAVGYGPDGGEDFPIFLVRKFLHVLFHNEVFVVDRCRYGIHQSQG